MPSAWRSRTGFTLVEVAVGCVVFGILILALTNTFIAIGVIQRESAHYSLAQRVAEQKIEGLRNHHYNNLALSPPPLDFSGELPDELASPRTATVTISEPSEGIKRLEVLLSWRESGRNRTIQLSALIGNIGISQ